MDIRSEDVNNVVNLNDVKVDRLHMVDLLAEASLCGRLMEIRVEQGVPLLLEEHAWLTAVFTGVRRRSDDPELQFLCSTVLDVLNII